MNKHFSTPLTLHAATLAVTLALGGCDFAAFDPPKVDPDLSHGTVLHSQTSASWDELAVEVPDEAILQYLNTFRARLELEPLRRSEQLELAATSHADFLLQHRDTYKDSGLSAHLQPADLNGFVAEQFYERVEFFGYSGLSLAEVVAFKPTSTAAARSWLESLYHRLPLLDPMAVEIGYGQAGDGTQWTNVLELGRPVGEAAGDHLVAWPIAGEIDVPTEWDGKEVPQPAAPPQGYPSGPVVTLQASRGEMVVETAIISSDLDGAQVPATVLTHDNDKAVPSWAMSVIPWSPLSPSTTYTVEIAGTLDDAPFSKIWTFTTRAAGCDLIGQECGPGQACYVVDGEPSCEWAGLGGVDAVCEFTNACAPGLTCLGSRCRPFCDDSNNASEDVACASHCPGGSRDAGAINDVSAGICLAEPCYEDADGCGEGQGCYWAGDFLCDWAGQLPEGAMCDGAAECQPDLACVGVGGSFSCQPLCGGAAFPACEDTCDGGTIDLTEDGRVKACQ